MSQYKTKIVKGTVVRKASGGDERWVVQKIGKDKDGYAIFVTPVGGDPKDMPIPLHRAEIDHGIYVAESQAEPEAVVETRTVKKVKQPKSKEQRRAAREAGKAKTK